MEKKESFKILVLGHGGMLGNVVFKYLARYTRHHVTTVNHRYPSQNFKDEILKSNPDYIINCIGAIPQKSPENYDINYDLPLWLIENCRKAKVIHPGTDCEIDVSDYGKSKKIMTDYVVNNHTNTKIIKTSIVGPERNTCDSLFSWVMSKRDDEKIKGYTAHFWSGITSLQWAKIALNMIEDWNKFNAMTIPDSKCISKYDLLKLIIKVFEKNNVVEKCDKLKVNKCLAGKLKVPDIEQQMIQLKIFIEETKKG
tara:strand:+ start:739 stop:1500 length:762 start_codon:yes stop_codon:yes gene_type:complete